MFYNARYYDPLLRRFISPDTIVPDPGNPQDLNRYSYVRNNPVMMADPTGHFGFFKKVASFAKGVGSGVVAAAQTTVAMVKDPKGTASALAGAASAAFHEGGGGVGGVLTAAKTVMVDPIVATVSAGVEAARTGDWETLGNVAGEGLFDALLTKGLGKIKKATKATRAPRPSCRNSFTGDTPVLLSDGTQVPISQIEEGDQVVATDPETGVTGPRTVVDNHPW